jgi:hypothetical protein
MPTKKETNIINEKQITQAEAMAAALRKLQTDGLTYGAFYKTDYLKELAGSWGTEKTFPFFMIALAGELRKKGFYITSAGLENEGFRIAQAVENFHIAQAWRTDAERAYDRGIILLANTDRNQLTEAEQLRDENALRQLRYEKRMLQRSQDVIAVVKKHKPKLLAADVETTAEPIPAT